MRWLRSLLLVVLFQPSCVATTRVAPVEFPTVDRNYQPNLSPATAEQSPTSTYGPIITPCSGPELVFLAVDSNFRQGVYYDCTDSQNPILLLGEESEDVPRGWQIADFDVSVDGKTLAMAIIQGSSVSGRGL